MKKIIFLSVLFLMSAVPAFAEQAESSTVKTAEEISYYAVIGVAIIAAMALAVIGGALGQGKCVSAAAKAVANNDKVSGKITITTVVGLAFIESLIIYVLVVNLILLFGNPFKI